MLQAFFPPVYTKALSRKILKEILNSLVTISLLSCVMPSRLPRCITAKGLVQGFPGLVPQRVRLGVLFDSMLKWDH